MNDNEKKVGAVLFAVGKEITAERIASLCSLEAENVEEALQSLQRYYEIQETSLCLVQKSQGWKLTVRDEFVPLVSNIIESTELERPLMDTLAVIAWKYPVVQSEVIKLRGSGAYEHMRILLEQEFIAKEKYGRTYKIKLTSKFFEYFDLPSEEAKQAFLNKVPQEVLEEAETVDREADEAEKAQEQEKSENIARKEIKNALEEAKKA